MAVRPLEMLRQLVLAVERTAAEEAASGVVKGAADGLREELSTVDQQLGSLLEDLLSAVGKVARTVAETDGEGAERTAHALAAAVARGALQELEREWQNGGMPLHEFATRLNRLLDRGAAYAQNRAAAYERPGDMARGIAEGSVEGASAKLRENLPEILGDLRALAPLAEEVAAHAGRGFVAGLQQKADEDRDAFARFVEQAGHALLSGLVSGLRQELRGVKAPSVEQVGAGISAIAAQTTSAAVRGAAGELALHRPSGSSMRGASREVARGVFDALGASLKPYTLAAVGAGGAVVALGLVALVRR